MGAFEWTLVGVIAIGVLAALMRSLLDVDMPRLFTGRRRSLAPGRFSSPRNRLRSRIRAAGGAAKRVPAAALDEIIAAKRAEAAQLATTGLSAYADPEKVLARLLEGEAVVVARLLRGERAIRGADETLRILVRHKATPDMSAERQGA